MASHGLGRKLGGNTHSPFIDEKERIIFPHLHLNSKRFPPVKDWKVGETYTIKIKIRQTSMTMERDKSVEGDFDILEAEVA